MLTGLEFLPCKKKLMEFGLLSPPVEVAALERPNSSPLLTMGWSLRSASLLTMVKIERMIENRHRLKQKKIRIDVGIIVFH